MKVLSRLQMYFFIFEMSSFSWLQLEYFFMSIAIENIQIKRKIAKISRIIHLRQRVRYQQIISILVQAALFT